MIHGLIIAAVKESKIGRVGAAALNSTFQLQVLACRGKGWVQHGPHQGVQGVGHRRARGGMRGRRGVRWSRPVVIPAIEVAQVVMPSRVWVPRVHARVLLGNVAIALVLVVMAVVEVRVAGGGRSLVKSMRPRGCRGRCIGRRRPSHVGTGGGEHAGSLVCPTLANHHHHVVVDHLADTLASGPSQTQLP